MAELTPGCRRAQRFVSGNFLSGESTVTSIASSRSVRFPKFEGRALSALAGLACVLLLCGLSQANTHRTQAWADTQFAKAEDQRATLNGKSSETRTRREYEAVIASYRLVVLEAPTSSKAEGSAFAVAEVTAEMGRRLKDERALYSAVREYKFLRKEYPGSKHRIEALLAIGEIYENDLGDAADARLTFQELLRRYPHSELVKQARTELDALGTEKNELGAGDASGSSAASKEPEGNQSNPAAGNSQSDAHSSAGQGAEVSDKAARVTDLQYWSGPDFTRVTLGLGQNVRFDAQRLDHPDRIFFDLSNARLATTLLGQSYDVDDGLVRKIRVAQYKPGRARIVVETTGHARYDAAVVLNPPRLVIDVRPENAQKTAPDSVVASIKPDLRSVSDEARPAKVDVVQPLPDENEAGAVRADRIKSTTTVDGVKRVVVEADDDQAATSSGSNAKSMKSRRAGMRHVASAEIRESQPTSSGDRSLIRALGLKIGKIVIDPGHGGHDTGTIGPNGLYEKDLVLDVSKRLGKLLEARLGADVVYTRHDDTFIPLETRTAIANQEQADLFVSVHANSSHDPDARGVETYYLNFTSAPDALEVAARENADSDKSIHELQDLVKKIALKEKIEESREFASDVQQSLHNGLAAKSPGERDRGVKKAPFVVLIGANMPSILAEISFISNPGDERRLRMPEYRQRIAESLYRGIARYVNGLGGVKVASRLEKASDN